MPKSELVHKPEYQEVSLEEFRNNLAELANRAGYGRERLVITRNGKRLAALVSIDDLERLPAA